ncbi:CHAT domain-containing protein [Mariniflexile ostreae]|uniref:CHAT domain-containing protein n=1 Tax=Mariniflexile ostreae TaxID=1520892 RepID=A0ABV5F956_9FLAO
MGMYKVYVLFFFISTMGFAQTLEESIYVATETFISNKSETAYQTLKKHMRFFKNQVKTKDEQLALVFSQCHQGFYLSENSRLYEATLTYEDALKRFQDHQLSSLSDFDIIENCLKPLGNLYIQTGDYTNAESIIKQYTFLAKQHKNTHHQVSGAINLAKLYQTIGNHETVLKLISNAFRISKISHKQKEHLHHIKSTSLIALNQYDERAASNRLEKPSTFQKERNNYAIALKNGNYNDALKAFNAAKVFLNDENLNTREQAKLHFQEAQLQHLLNLPDQALETLQRAIKTLIPEFNTNSLPNQAHLYAENTFIDIFDLYAVLQKNPEQALKSYDLSFHVSELLQDNWTSQEAKIINETNNRIRSEKCISLLFDWYQQTKDKAALSKALHYSENSKASTLKAIFQKKMRLRKFPTDSLLIQELELLKAQERITSLLIKEQLSANRASKINDLSRQLSGISLEIKAIKPAISKKHADSKNPFPLKALQEQLLKDNAVLMEYFYGETAIYQFIVSGTKIFLNKIDLNSTSKNKILEYIHLFDEASIINNDIDLFTHKAFDLYKFLNFDAVSSHKNVMLIPDGLLNFIPFETLLNSKKKTTSFSNMPFVVKTQNIAYNASTFFYLAKNKTTPAPKLLGVFPVFENTKKQLTYSVNEAQAVIDETQATLLMNNEASKANFIQNAPQYGVLHLSTHASSGNLTKPANIDFYDETLYLNELYSLNLNADLVVLSACETGIGKLYKGEGPMSIARGFQYSGAKNLLFSLWQINDLSTSQIMHAFYSSYNKTHSAYNSNRQSKLDYLQNEDISNVKKSPYYWGAFVYYGDITKPNDSIPLLYILIGIILILIAVFLLLKLKKSHGKIIAGISN